jgi:hypothetical protein
MLVEEIRFAVRVMRRTPVFSATVILTVALAIVANTTIFSAVNSVLLKRCPSKTRKRWCRWRRRTTN